MINEYSKSVRLIIEDLYPEQFFKTLSINSYINHVLTVTKIYHLEIQENICFCKLCEILSLLPELDTLRLYSISFSKLDYLSDEELDNLVILLIKNQVKKFSLEKRIGMEEFHLLISSLPHLNYFQINCVDYKYAQYLLKFILKFLKNEPNDFLRLFCFSIPAADDNMVKKLEDIIWNFTIKRVLDNIYVHRK